MSREEVASFLRNVQLSLDTLQRQLDDRVRQLPEVPRSELPAFLRDQKAALSKLFSEQLEEFRRFEEETGLSVQAEQASPLSAHGTDVGEATTPFGGVQLRSLEQRVTSMGGRPALGACVLPKSTLGLRAQLAATSSPAAVEIMRGKMGGDGDSVTPLRKTGSEGEVAHTPLVQLRKVDTPVTAGGRVAGEASPASELAAALKRRLALRQAQQEAAESEAVAVMSP